MWCHSIDSVLYVIGSGHEGYVDDGIRGFNLDHLKELATSLDLLGRVITNLKVQHVLMCDIEAPQLRIKSLQVLLSEILLQLLASVYLLPEAILSLIVLYQKIDKLRGLRVCLVNHLIISLLLLTSWTRGSLDLEVMILMPDVDQDHDNRIFKVFPEDSK